MTAEGKSANARAWAVGAGIVLLAGLGLAFIFWRAGYAVEAGALAAATSAAAGWHVRQARRDAADRARVEAAEARRIQDAVNAAVAGDGATARDADADEYDTAEAAADRFNRRPR